MSTAGASWCKTATTTLSWVLSGLARAAGGSWAQTGAVLHYAAELPLAWVAASGWRTPAESDGAGTGTALRAVWVAESALAVNALAVGGLAVGGLAVVGIQIHGCGDACHLTGDESRPQEMAAGMRQDAAVLGGNASVAPAQFAADSLDFRILEFAVSSVYLHKQHLHCDVRYPKRKMSGYTSGLERHCPAKLQACD